MKKNILGLLFAIILIGCSSSSNDSSTSTTSPYQGHWTGNYTGTGGSSNSGDSGTWTVNVSSTGAVTGSATSTVFSQVFQIVGSVNSSGVLVTTFGSSSDGGTFNGQLSISPNSAHGTWINNHTTPNYTGTWSGLKQ